MEVLVEAAGGEWLKAARLRAGFSSAETLDRSLQTGMSAVCEWEGERRRPSWRYVQALAHALQVPEEDIILHLWGERIGDPCPGGCGGVKVLPVRSDAHSLLIELPCARCGKPRTYVCQGPATCKRTHFQRCPACSRVKGRAVFTCVGYDDHGVNRHARGCPQTRALLPGEVREYQRAVPKSHQWGRGQYRPRKWDKPFLNEAKGTFRCRNCALASLAIATTERRLAGQTERIRSGSLRREGLRAVAHLVNPNFTENVKARALGPARLKEGVTDQARRARAAGALVKAWSRTPLPYGVSRCRWCGKLTSGGQQHRACFVRWCRTPEGHRWLSRRPREPMPPPLATPGRPHDPETTRRHFAWAVQRRLGDKPFRAIARAEGVTAKAVRKAIVGIIADLPPPELVPQAFRLRIELLLEATPN